MKPRIEYRKVEPGAIEAMSGLERYLTTCGLEPTLLELVKLRASQVNGCAYCIDMHTKDARAHGEREQRLYALRCLARNPFLFQARTRRAGLD